MAKDLSSGTRQLGDDHSAFNKCKNGHEQCTGGCGDDTPDQVGRNNVNASVELAYPHRIDSMGGSENRGKDNKPRKG